MLSTLGEPVSPYSYALSVRSWSWASSIRRLRTLILLRSDSTDRELGLFGLFLISTLLRLATSDFLNACVFSSDVGILRLLEFNQVAIALYSFRLQNEIISSSACLDRLGNLWVVTVIYEVRPSHACGVGLGFVECRLYLPKSLLGFKLVRVWVVEQG